MSTKQHPLRHRSYIIHRRDVISRCEPRDRSPIDNISILSRNKRNIYTAVTAIMRRTLTQSSDESWFIMPVVGALQQTTNRTERNALKYCIITYVRTEPVITATCLQKAPHVICTGDSMLRPIPNCKPTPLLTPLRNNRLMLCKHDGFTTALVKILSIIS